MVVVGEAEIPTPAPRETSGDGRPIGGAATPAIGAATAGSDVGALDNAGPEAGGDKAAARC